MILRKLIQPTTFSTKFITTKSDKLLPRSSQNVLKPKIPLKPYLRFAMKYYNVFRSKYPQECSTDIMKRLDIVWNQLDTNIRSEYYDLYSMELEKYFKEVKVDNDDMCEVKQKAVEKEHSSIQRNFMTQYFKKPRKPPNSFLLYVNDMKKNESVVLRSPKDCREYTKRMGQVWKHVNTEEKEKYKKKFDQLMKEYKLKELEWEKLVVEAGYSFLLPVHLRINFQPTNDRHTTKSSVEINRPAEHLP